MLHSPCPACFFFTFFPSLFQKAATNQKRGWRKEEERKSTMKQGSKELELLMFQSRQRKEVKIYVLEVV